MNPKNIGLTFLIGLTGGILFYLLHLPLPWILGPAFATMIMNTIRPQQVEWPRWLGDAGIVVVAFLLGRTVNMDTVQTMLHDLPGMLSSGFMWIGICFVIGLIFAKMAGLTPMDGVLGCVPGGLSQMVLVAEDMKGADPGIVAIIQTARLVVVLYSVPFLATVLALSGAGAGAVPDAAEPINAVGPAAGVIEAERWPGYVGYLALPLVPLTGWLSRRIRMPAGEFIGPFLLVGALSVAGMPWPSIPGGMLSFSQVLIGIFIGKRVQPRIMWTNKRLGPMAIVSGGILVVITAAAAWILTFRTPDSIVTWFLALAPGGLGEVAVTALVLGADVQQVTAYQMFRLIIVLVVAPPMLKLIMQKKQRQPS